MAGILPHLTAGLNALAALLLLAGFTLICLHRKTAHRIVMTAAVTTSILFLVAYLLHHLTAPVFVFPGQGVIRPIYFAMLISHVVLAAVVTPMVAVTFLRARRGLFERHSGAGPLDLARLALCLADRHRGLFARLPPLPAGGVMRDTLDLPPGFPPSALTWRPRRALSGWLLLALGSLAVAGGLALLLALARTPGVQDWLPWPWASFFRKALVAHVVFAFVVWYMAMLGGLAAAARPGSATSLLGLALATAGAVLLLVPTLTNQGRGVP